MLTAITGASGFVGSVLTRRLAAEGRQIRCLDLVRNRVLEGLDVDWMSIDVLDRASLDEGLRGVGVVYHLAAVISVTGDPTGRVRQVNVEGVRNVAEAALGAGVRRFVHCSSVHAYDLEAVDHLSEDSPRATNPALPAYDRSKAAGETALRESIGRGLDAVVVNPTGVFGPDDAAQSRINTMLLAMFQGRLPALLDGGFDWVDVRDVASGLIAAETKGRTGENYLLPGHHLSLRELSEVAHAVSGVPRPKIVLPMWIARVGSPVSNAVSRRTGNPLWYTSESLHALRFDPTVSRAKAEEELGYRPRPTDQTVRDIHRWAIRQGLLATLEVTEPQGQVT